jgi:hypothetical protein
MDAEVFGLLGGVKIAWRVATKWHILHPEN